MLFLTQGATAPNADVFVSTPASAAHRVDTDDDDDARRRVERRRVEGATTREEAGDREDAMPCARIAE